MRISSAIPPRGLSGGKLKASPTRTQVNTPSSARAAVCSQNAVCAQNDSSLPGELGHQPTAWAQTKRTSCATPPPSPLPEGHLWNLGLRHIQEASALENQPDPCPRRGLLCAPVMGSGVTRWVQRQLLHSGPAHTDQSDCHTLTCRLLCLKDHIREISKYPLSLPATPGKDHFSSELG